MTETTVQDHLQTPAEWKHLESQHVGPFLTRMIHERKDGSTHIWSSRRHRKNFGPEILTSEGEPQALKKRPSLFVWAPGELNWWIAVLFMIGSFGFILGSVMFLTGFSNDMLINATFFIGSVFFTSAGYSQYNQSINAATTIGSDSMPKKRKWFALQPGRIDFWVTFSQFLGTIMFNFNTFDAFLDLGWLGQDLAIWRPDMIGSILFQISGTLAVFEVCHRWWCWQRRRIAWWITMINFIGCVAFLISAFMAFVRPNPIFENLATYATIFTLIGAVCFFVGSYLMWPEMSAEVMAGE
ncbi:MAG: hypothetical protein ACK2UM_09880 [Anaerolineales bacterium]